MAKVIFNTFREACEFSKNIAIATKTTSSVHREGDRWWVEDQDNEAQSIYVDSKRLMQEIIPDPNNKPIISMPNNNEVKEVNSNDGYVLCPLNGYVKMVDGFWVNRKGERIDTGKYARSIAGRNRTIRNTSTAYIGLTDSGNHD